MSRASFQTGRNKTLELYSDFSTDLTPHPNSGDAFLLSNEFAVRRSIRNLVLTNRTERLFAPNLGGDIRKMLFDPISPETALMIESNIREVLGNYEKRAKIINVEVTPIEVDQSYRVNIYFYVVNVLEPTAVSVVLKRVR